MKYKVGDKVKVKSFLWYNENYPDCGGFMLNGVWFTKEMSHYCGEIATITKCNGVCYRIDIDKGVWSWHDWMLEDEPTVSDQLKEKRLHAACCAMNGIVSGLMQSEEWHGWTEKYIVERAYLLADELLKQGGFAE